jgi:hypothetical protein
MTFSIMHGLSRALTRAISLILICAMLALSVGSANARFISPDDYDPTLPGVGTNRYAYSQNDPVNKADPNGHAVPVIAGIIAAILSWFSGTAPANTPAPGEKPVSISEKQQMANMLGGAGAGVKASAFVAAVIKDQIKKKKEEKERVLKEAAAQSAALNAELPNKIKPEIGNKLDFLLGKATGDPKNVVRSKDMLRSMESIGLRDNATTRQYLSEQLETAVNQADNIVKTQADGRVVRETLLMGPNGGVKLETVWDGAKLITGIIYR